MYKRQVQEVVASCEVVSRQFPEIKTFVDIGGEDSKMIFFESGKTPDIRMNGSCAGGTGSFIDQMATLLNVDMNEFNSLAEQAETIYPVSYTHLDVYKRQVYISQQQ